MRPDYPARLHIPAVLSLVVDAVPATVIAVHDARRPRHMWTMYLVRRLAALFGGPIRLLMQCAMPALFATSDRVNRWLVRRGVGERM